MGIAGFWIGFIIQILILHIYRLQETETNLDLKGLAHLKIIIL